MKTDPLFSIITVTLDNVSGLEKTWKSLAAQSCRDFQWIVIDGRSKDDTLTFLQKTDAEWISEMDAGIYDAMNKGIEHAKGHYVLFLNAGDTLADPSTLKSLKSLVDKNPDFIYGDSYESTEGKLHYKPARPAEKINKGMPTHHQAMLYRRETIGNLRFNTDYKIAADYDFTIRFLQKSKSTAYAPIPVCIFESGGISQQNAALGRREEFKIRRALNMQAITPYMRQSLSWKLKKLRPSLYWALKSSCNNARG